MKKLLILSTLTLATSINAFAAIAPTDRITLTGTIYSQLGSSGVNSASITVTNGASSNITAIQNQGETPVQVNYDLNTPIQLGFYAQMGSESNMQQLYCSYQITTTKNDDGSYNTQITQLNQGPHMNCQVTAPTSSNNYTISFSFATN